MRRLVLLAFCCAASALAGGVAHAQQPAPGDGNASAEADRFFQLGKEASKARKLPEALDNYRRAWELKQSPDIACNLGNVELELGKHRDAAEHLSYCVRHYPPSGAAEGKQYATQRLDKVKAEVGAVNVEVTVDDATVFVDGKRIGRSPLLGDVFVDPGEHTFEAKLPGYADAKTVVTATKGGRQQIRLQLAADAQASPAPVPGAAVPPAAGEGGGSQTPEAVTPTESKKSVPLIVAGLAVGSVGLGMGVAFLAVSSGASTDADALLADVTKVGGNSACANPTPALASKCSDLSSKRSDASTFGTLSAVSFIVGGLALAGTVTYLFLPTSSSSTTGTKGTVQAAPVVGPHTAGAFVTGSF